MFPAVFNLTTLNGKNGFVLNGITPVNSGVSLSTAGDVNGDGIDDVIIGVPTASPNNNLAAGQSYVVFGNKDGFISPFNLSSLNGNNGFTLNGIGQQEGYAGYSVSAAGDVNGDGIDDVVIGAPYVSIGMNRSVGQSYVVFGSRDVFPAVLNLINLNGVNGFTVSGINAGDTSGESVGGAGDINGDGIDDIIIGAPNANNNVGQSYVVFGSRNAFPAQFGLSSLDGTNGFTLNGINSYDYSGSSVSADGDVNGDGIDDIIIGAPNANNNAGQSYVVFGSKDGFISTLSLSSLNGNNGFTLNGIKAGDRSSVSISMGDTNNDGIDDIIIGAWGALNRAGQSYIVFGSENPFPATFNLTNLNGANGFTINGINAADGSGSSVSTAGDVNGDGITDIIIGAPDANNNAGQGYVVFGNKSFNSIFYLENLNGENGFTINGVSSYDLVGGTVSYAGDINDDGIADIVINGNTEIQAYVIFGESNSADSLLI